MKLFLSFFILIFSLITSTYTDCKKKPKKYNASEIESCKILSDIYDFWWDNDEYSWFSTKDSKPYFVDTRNYKGIINYGVEFSAPDRKNFQFIENVTMYDMHVEFDKFEFSLKDSIVEFEGTIATNRSWKGRVTNNVDIFIGEKKDTFNTVNISHLIDTSKVIAQYNGKKIIDDITLDTLPSFYIRNYKHHRTNADKIRTFNVKAKINEKSILVFGLGSCYSQIYDIGKLIFSKQNKNNGRVSSVVSAPKAIIRNNEQVYNEKENYKKIPKYFQNTTKSENFILNSQYGKAKSLYLETLKSQKKLFARDLHNAVRCAILSRDYKTAILFCEQLTQKGVTKEYFNSKIFNNLRKSPLWNSFIDNYEKLHLEFKKNQNLILLKQLGYLIKKDQIAYNKNSANEISRRELTATTDSINNELLKLLNKEGFPTEEKIGISTKNDTIMNVIPDYYVLFYHNYQTKGKNFNEIEKVRLQNARELKYDAYRDNLNILKNNGNTCLKIYKGKLYNNKTCGPANKKQLNKIAFRFNNKYDFIISGGDFSVEPYEGNKENERFFLEKFNFITKLTDDWFWYEK